MSMKINPQLRLVLPDLHIPYHDKLATARWMQHAKELQPYAIDLIGDLIDCYALSSFDKNPSRQSSLQDEIDQGQDFLSELRSVVGSKCEIHYSEGNHEARIRKLLWGKCSQFAGLRNLTIPELLRLDSFNIQWHPSGIPYNAGSLWFTHGKKINQTAGVAAKLTSDKAGCSIVMGHGHRMGWIPTTDWAGCREGIEVGHLCDPAQLEYLDSPPNWQQGWCTIEIGKDYHDVNFVKVVQSGKKKLFVYKGSIL